MPLFSCLGEQQACTPTTELFFQPLNFKRKCLQIHFARNAISLFSLENIYSIGHLRRDFLIHVSCQNIIRSQFQISPPELVLGYPRGQIMAQGTQLGRCQFATSDQQYRSPERDEGLAPNFALFLMESA